jgi:hypothetical protein
MRAGIGFSAFALPLALVGACFSNSSTTSDAGAFFMEDADIGHDSTTLGDVVIAPDDAGDSSPADATSVDSSARDSSPDTGTGVDTGADAAHEAEAAAPPTYAQTVMSDSPLSYWRFGESNGTVANDSAGATNGTYFAGFTLGATGAIANDTNTAVSFDGMSGYAAFGSSFNFTGTSSMSIELWIKPAPADASFRRVLSKETIDGNGREGYLIGYEGANNLSFERFESGAETAVGATITPNVYSHVVATFDGTTMIIYVNGAAVQSSVAPQAIAAFNDSFNVATYSTEMTADCFEGVVDEVAVYDHALTSQRIQTHYRVGTGM